MNFKNIIILCTILCTGVLGKYDRIVGGFRANIADHPYQVALKVTYIDFYFCGGTIISQWHVLTAAHCIYGREMYYPDMRIYAGSTLLNSRFAVMHDIMTFDVHPQYTGVSNMEQAWLFDIAALTVQQPFQFTQYVSSIDLPTNPVPMYVQVTATGWGKRNINQQSNPQNLRKINMTTITTSDCQLFFERTIHSRHLCVRNEVGIGSCHGDSGGPLVYDGILVGILSWLVPCALGYPDVYTDIYDHIDFIRYILGRPVDLDFSEH